MKKQLKIFLVIALFASTACTKETEEKTTGTEQNLPLVAAFPELSFTRPVDFQHAGDKSNKLYVVEQRGVISVFENEQKTSTKATFLSIEDRVEDSDNEEGLLGLAFHPNFESNGYFYVNYTASNPDRSVISRFNLSSTNPDEADPNSELVLLEYEQPYGNHNGGQIAFGPDYYLYIGVGDGGKSGDPHGHGQNRSTLLGNILRIDVDQENGAMPYSIPDDNPFAGNTEGFKEEIYAYGMRNPWRFSFDTATDQLWVADVGQNSYEEIDIVKNGGNYGWNTMEGFHCFKADECNQENLELPIWEYDRDEGDISITGGFVYHGEALPQLQGLYIYADYVSGRIWSLDFSDTENPVNTELFKADFPISSFGVDQNQEIYICGFDDKIYKFGLE
ncbi:PQQ-dependent sugar dehydrogenase [Cyclobacterium marinum]|uniref:Glucose/sorbosone dehydrogenase n=1 Tax=Cyclobacterium marinum (strain ATCC 25205 / DSM 745 / LMG 13164 / NCIMB 1802) TaxID=880070 RepID=G0IV70_CYCMS|nr:PQQ-dependent sugar dehydrogenase [Cyclobacterium marinum]AEL27061.1 glucose/sorbosone dehydrogenase [Cyclobacterium marinum DSM 745]